MRIERVPKATVYDFVRTHHYSGGCHNGPICFAAFEPPAIGEGPDALVAAVLFATPVSEAVRASVFGPAKALKDSVIELHRLVLLPCRNGDRTTATWAISHAIGALVAYGRTKGRRYHAVISYADAAEGHRGGVYRAANFRYCGEGGRAKGVRYFDAEGRLRHSRQCGVNITPDEATARGWRVEPYEGVKHRFVFFTTPKGARAALPLWQEVTR